MLRYSLDIGTTNLRFAGADLSGGNFKLIGAVSVVAEGYSGGVITDYRKLFFSVLKIIKDFEKRFGCRPKKITVNCSHPQSQFHRIREVFQRNFPDKPITQKELNYFCAQLIKDKIILEEKEIFTQVEEYIVDGQRGIVNPDRMVAGNIEIIFNVITIPVNIFNNISAMFTEAGIELEGIVPEIIAKSSVHIDEESKSAGVMLLDLGWSKTKLAVFKNGILKNSMIFASGFDGSFDKFKNMFHLNDAEADSVLKYAMVTEESSFSIQAQNQDEIKEVSIDNVKNILDKEFRKNLYYVRKIMEDKDIIPVLNKGIVITGGFILEYPGLKEIASQILKQPVSIKKGKLFSLSSDYGAAIGMLMYCYQKDKDFLEKFGNYNFIKKNLSKIYGFFDKYF